MGEAAAIPKGGMRRGQNSPVDKWSEKTSPGALGTKEKVPVLSYMVSHTNTSERYTRLSGALGSGRKGGEMRSLWTFAVACAAIIFCSAKLVFPMDVTLAWDANTESDIAGYKIYYDTDSGPPYDGTGADLGDSPIDVPLSMDEDPDPSTFQYTLLNLPGETYYFAVTAYDSETPFNESGYSNEASNDTTPPVISSVRATAVTDKMAQIAWTTDEPSNSQVQYGVVSEAYPYNKSSIDMVTSHYITLTQLKPNTTYFFIVSSTDAYGNGPTISTEQTFITDAAPDTNPPSVVQYPSIDFANRTIDVTYSEPNMQNAETESNYVFSPSLLFRSSGESGDIVLLDGSTYRLYMGYIPSRTIFKLTLSNITDEAGNQLAPAVVRINDDDDDGMADDWEAANQIDSPIEDADSDGLDNLEEFQNLTDPNSWDTDGDALPDAWEVVYGLDPRDGDGPNGADGDIDGDGWSNYEEYVADTNPADGTSRIELITPEIVESIPHHNAGITDTYRVSNDTAFSVRIEASTGINVTEEENVVFAIDDGVNSPYQRHLGDDVVKVVKLSDDPDTRLTQLWVVYDRAGDTYGNFPFDAYVRITVNAKDTTGHQEVEETYDFKIESEIAHLEANDAANLPSTSVIGMSDPAIDGTTWDAGIEVDSGDLRGAKIVHNSAEAITPRFGPAYELPALTAEQINAVGVGMNLQPPAVFATPVKLFIPCPGYEDVSSLSVLLYNGTEWVLACDSNGNVMPDGEGWMVPGSRANHNFLDDPSNDPSTIEILVYHFSGAQAAEAGEASSTTDLALQGSGSCFAATAASRTRPFSSRVELVGMFSDFSASEFGKAFAGAIALGVVFALCLRRKRKLR